MTRALYTIQDIGWADQTRAAVRFSAMLEGVPATVVGTALITVVAGATGAQIEAAITAAVKAEMERQTGETVSAALKV